MKINWVNFLHAYQPPWQSKEMVDKVVNDCYWKLIIWAEKYKYFKVTMNISGALLELLLEYGHLDILDRFKKLEDTGRLELVGSAMYHPILPLVSEDTVIRQIEKNDKISREVFGQLYNPKGFYLPEMAVSANVLEIIKKQGYEWVILDSVSSSEKIKIGKGYKIKTGLKIIFRDGEISKTYVPETVGKILNQGLDKIIISATDAELYGHHHIDFAGVFEKVLKRKDEVVFWKCSDWLRSLDVFETVSLRPSSWETSCLQIKNNNPFPLWKDPQNLIQTKLWRFVNEIEKVLNKNKTDSNFFWAQNHFDRGIASCTFWWCSSLQPSPFCPITWNPDEIEMGLLELVKSIRSLDNLDKKIKISFEENYLDLKHLIWKNHWQKEN